MCGSVHMLSPSRNWQRVFPVDSMGACCPCVFGLRVCQGREPGSEPAPNPPNPHSRPPKILEHTFGQFQILPGNLGDKGGKFFLLLYGRGLKNFTPMCVYSKYSGKKLCLLKFDTRTQRGRE